MLSPGRPDRVRIPASSLPRPTVAMVIALFGVTTGFPGTGQCLDRALSVEAAKAQATGGRWVPTGSLNTARSDHTATLLPNGKVLVVGGRGIDPYPHNVLDTAELYDPTTGTWSATGRLNAAKSGHTATLLPNGQVLVVGQANSATESAELYDPSTGRWSPTASGTGHWRDHTATLLKNGMVLVAGGWGDPYSSYRAAALYDPATGSWRSTGSLISLRGAGHQATLLQDGRVLVTGGTNDADFVFPVSDAELYDPATGTWSRASSLNTARHSHSATLLPNGTVLIAGGFGPPDQFPAGCATTPSSSCALFDTPTHSVELFDPAIGRWNNIGMLNAARVRHTATLLLNGEVLVAGGVNLTGAELYDALRAIWNIAGDLNTARSGHTATLLPDGKVLLAGGVNALGLLNSAELYEEASSPGTIGPGFTGSWFDPAQSGHGLFIEVLPNNRLLAGWLAFNPAGTGQAWIIGVGTYRGNTATIINVEQPTGGRWIPNFDPNQIVSNLWGTLTFTFTDCNHGRVDFNSVTGYGTGSMNLTRLTQPEGLTCP